MNGSPFRSLSLGRLFPRLRPGKQAGLLATLLLFVTGCGAGGSGGEQTVRQPRFAFPAPASWDVRRQGTVVSASEGDAAVSVTVFRIARPFRPELWAQVVGELDGVADRLATELGADVGERTTRLVAGRRARLYEFSDARDDTRRIAFLLSGRSEFQLLCRWSDETADDGEEACRRLLAGFTLF